MRTLRALGDVKNKKILLRVDFDVPVENGQIVEKFRIEKQKETLDYLLNQGARVIMAGHLHTNTDSFSVLVPQLHIILGHEVNFIKNPADISNYLSNYAGPALLENVKSFDSEGISQELVKAVAGNFDFYVDNAFAASHHTYPLVSAVASTLPCHAGFLVEEEVAQLSKIIDAPKEGKVMVIGGAKAETKVPVIKSFINKADKMLIGGVVANDILKERGHDVGASMADENSKELLVGLDLDSSVLALPKDFRISENKILDIGPETEKEYGEIISAAEMVIWNGPMGLFENPDFAQGTKAVAEAMVSSKARKIIGGGDTITAVDSMGLLGKFDFVSTGGGAMLAFLAGEKLPGLEMLGYYN